MQLFFVFFYFRKKNVGKHIFSYDKPTEISKKGIVYQSAKFWRARARASASERERAARSLARLKIKKEPLAFARVHFPKHQLASSSSSRASPGNSRADFEEFRWTKVLYHLISFNCD